MSGTVTLVLGKKDVLHCLFNEFARFDCEATGAFDAVQRGITQVEEWIAERDADFQCRLRSAEQELDNAKRELRTCESDGYYDADGVYMEPNCSFELDQANNAQSDLEAVEEKIRLLSLWKRSLLADIMSLEEGLRRFSTSVLNAAPERQNLLREKALRYEDGIRHLESVSAGGGAFSRKPDRTCSGTQVVAPLAAVTSVRRLVSKSIGLVDLPESDLVREDVLKALKLIDSVHQDGKLPKLNVDAALLNLKKLGTYRFDTSPPSIGLLPIGPWKCLTACHEVGHFLDHHALGNGAIAPDQVFGSSQLPVFDSWRKAVKTSESVRFIEDSHGRMAEKTRSYLLNPTELFARSYAQYIAEKSQDSQILDELAACLDNCCYRQWSTEDFAPIRDALDEAFRELGWIQ